MINETAAADFGQYVLAQYPKEACGVLVEDRFLPCRNISTTPTSAFQISATELAGIGSQYGKIQAILHSHPYLSSAPPKWEASWPSHKDMEQWLKSDVAWGIVGTEGENISPMVWLDEANPAPLEKREFVHGVWDCYSAVRDWLKLKHGLTIKNYPRAMGWWERGHDHYNQNFADAGFIEVARSEARVGDVCLMQVRSKVINHAAIITGSNEIFQQLYHRYSAYDSFSKWERMVTKYVRFNGKANA